MSLEERVEELERHVVRLTEMVEAMAEELAVQDPDITGVRRFAARVRAREGKS